MSETNAGDGVKECKDEGPFVMSRYLNKEDLYKAMNAHIESLQSQLLAAQSEIKDLRHELKMQLGYEGWRVRDICVSALQEIGPEPWKYKTLKKVGEIVSETLAKLTNGGR